jgi:hypothetical protein
MMRPFDHKDNVPSQLLPTFLKGIKTQSEWTQLIIDTILGDFKSRNYYANDATAPKEGEDFGEEDPNGNEPMEEAGFDEESTISLCVEGGDFDGMEVDIE